jgi:hypothetical protein
MRATLLVLIALLLTGCGREYYFWTSNSTSNSRESVIGPFVDIETCEAVREETKRKRTYDRTSVCWRGR